MRYLTLEQIITLHGLALARTGGSPGLRDRAALESAAAQPRMTFGGQELYPTWAEKAAALAFSLTQNHPFVDGNKRAGHAAMEVFLVLNGYEIAASTDEQEQLFLSLDAGQVSRAALAEWLQNHLIPYPNALQPPA